MVSSKLYIDFPSRSAYLSRTNPLSDYNASYPVDDDPQLQDPWDQGIAIFDMTDLNFKDSYEVKADPYEPPYAIQQYYNSR